MNFIRFLENRFQELRLESDKVDAFELKTDSEIKAIHQILEKTRDLSKLAYIPKVLYDFALVQLGKREEPEPVMVNKLKAQKEQKELEKELEKAPNSLQAVPNEADQEKTSKAH